MLLVCSLIAYVPLTPAMKRALTCPAAEDLKRGRDHTEPLDELALLSLQSPEKKGRADQEHVIKKPISSMDWQEVFIASNKLATLHPVEKIITIEVRVDPIAHAVYYDNVPALKNIFENRSYAVKIASLHFLTNRLLDQADQATILDIAAERRSYNCLQYFIDILNMESPTLTLQAFAARALDKKDIQKVIESNAISADHQEAANTLVQWRKEPICLPLTELIKPKLIDLIKFSASSSLRISRNMGDLRGAQLIWDCAKRYVQP